MDTSTKPYPPADSKAVDQQPAQTEDEDHDPRACYRNALNAALGINITAAALAGSIVNHTSSIDEARYKKLCARVAGLSEALHDLQNDKKIKNDGEYMFILTLTISFLSEKLIVQMQKNANEDDDHS